jgi:XRE family aerobic/anaerobic benzoate catabolism transcriptional regulator
MPLVPDQEFLAALGRRVRDTRERRGVTRKVLASQADVSERYLGQLELGEGNASIVLLRRVAAALGVTLVDLLDGDARDAEAERLVRRLLERVPSGQLEHVVSRLAREFGRDDAARRRRIALVGLRGAGKSTLGALLARQRDVDFVELNREIERETRLPAGEVFSLYGQTGYRRFERRALERVLADREAAVISAGGGIVAGGETYDLLLNGCFTVWLRASPEEHMSRVLAQGDLRPMAGKRAAMEDLRRILAERESLYGRADAVVDTSGETPRQSLARLRAVVPN